MVKVGVVGLGKLGLPLVAVMSKHWKVVGVDCNEELVKKLKDGEIPYDEPHLEEYLEKAYYNNKIKYSTDYKDLSKCDYIFCIVPTPSKKDGKFDNSYIEKAITGCKNLKKDCIFVVVSTVMPGSCKKFKKKIPNLCYNPEFIALGNVIEGIEKPDYVLLGTEDVHIESRMTHLYKQITKAPIINMDFVSAEIAKIAQNSYITQKITFANTLWWLVDDLGGKIDDVLNALGTDSRIGHKYLKAGAPYGGPCFPRDNRALSTIMDFEGYQDLTDSLNESHVWWIFHKIKEKLGSLNNKNISIMGMGYSKNNDLRFESPSDKLACLLLSSGAKVFEDDLADADLIVFMKPAVEGDKQIMNIAKRHGIKVLDVWRDK